MIFYELEMKYEANEDKAEASYNEKLQLEPETTDVSNTWINLIKSVNRGLGTGFAFDGELSVYVWKATPGLFNLIMAVNLEKVILEDCLEYLHKDFEKRYAIKIAGLKIIKEMSTQEFNACGDRGCSAGYIMRWMDRALKNDFFDNNTFKVDERISEDAELSYEDAREEATKILADKSFLDELDRIYSDCNSKEYFGNPVHYYINATNDKSGKDIVKILAQALFSNGRLLGRRIAYISDISEHCYREEDVKNLIMNAQGCIVVIDLAGENQDAGNYATTFQMVIDSFEKLIRKYCLKTLFVFIKQAEHPGFADAFMNRVNSTVDIINIREGAGGRRSALEYLNTIINSNGFKATEEDLEKMLGTANSFSVTEIYDIYNTWFKDGLRTNIYKAYAKCAMEVTDKKITKSTPIRRT